MTMTTDISLRGSVSLYLLEAEAFLQKASLNSFDRESAQQGLALSWRWVEGERVKPFSLCDYIDGEINLPIRSTLCVPDSPEDDAMSSAFLAIGLAALYCCEEVGATPSSSVANFGSNEAGVLEDLLIRLDGFDRRRLERAREWLKQAGESSRGGFGLPISRSELLSRIA